MASLPFMRILFSTLSLPIDRDAHVGANGRTFLAGDAVLVADGNGVLPSLGVEVTDDLDHIARALGNAKFAALTALAVDFNVRRTHFINLQGVKLTRAFPQRTPEFHKRKEGKD
jgi:hypothetical protein